MDSKKSFSFLNVVALDFNIIKKLSHLPALGLDNILHHPNRQNNLPPRFLHLPTTSPLLQGLASCRKNHLLVLLNIKF